MLRRVSKGLTVLALSGLSFLPLVVRAEDSLPITAGCPCSGTFASTPVDSQPVFRFTADRRTAVRQSVAKKDPAHFVHDIRGKFDAEKLKAGTNILDRDEAGFQLAVVAEAGKQLRFTILDGDGQPLPSNASKKTMAKGKTTCWQCGTDASGDTHCWVVPCPDITGPWVPKATQVRQ